MVCFCIIVIVIGVLVWFMYSYHSAGFTGTGSVKHPEAYGHDDVIKWKHFLRYWPFVRGIHRSTVNSPHKGQWCGALMFSLICAWINGWVNNGEAGDLRPYRAHYGVTVMVKENSTETKRQPCTVLPVIYCMYAHRWGPRTYFTNGLWASSLLEFYEENILL